MIELEEQKARKISGCHRCGRDWNECERHCTPHVYSPDGRAAGECFPLCEECWSALSVEDRLPFYRELFNIWLSSGFPDQNGHSYDSVWNTIEENVLSGK